MKSSIYKKTEYYLYNYKNIDKIILVNDEDAINEARKIVLNLEIGVGISSFNFISNNV